MVAASRPARSTTARVLAPVAFLLAVTIAVLLVRAGLRDETTPAPARGGGVTAVEPAYYVIRRGDTLASIATRYGTTVAAVRQLNPGVDPVSLDVGRRLRVR